MAHEQVLNYKQILNRLAAPVLFILVAVIARIVPHAPNFTPIAAMALFGGVYMARKQAFILPIAAMVLSDFVIGFDSIPMRLTVYGSFLMMVLIGFWLKSHKKFGNTLAASLFGSVLFFMATNFMVWAEGSLYAKGLTGLLESYTFAIPFFKNTLLGDLFYTGVFFGGYEFVRSLTTKSKFAFES
jgi:hypothetical protein